MARNNHNPVMVWIIKIIPKINAKFCDVLILDSVSKSLSVLFVIAALKSGLSREQVAFTFYSLHHLVCCGPWSSSVSLYFYHLHLCMAYSCAMKMEAAASSETSDNLPDYTLSQTLIFR